MANHTTTKQVKYACNKRDILHAIGMTEDEYNIFQFDTAVEWLHQKVWDDTELVNFIIADHEFKSWWQLQWNLREDAFVWDYIGYLIAPDNFKAYVSQAWRDIHRVKYINLLLPEELIARSVKKISKGGSL
jgi:hypothetical protein